MMDLLVVLGFFALLLIPTYTAWQTGGREAVYATDDASPAPKPDFLEAIVIRPRVMLPDANFTMPPALPAVAVMPSVHHEQPAELERAA